MSVISRVLAAVLAVGALLIGLLASTASAGTATSTLPVADPPPSIAQLCAATGDQSIDALLDGVADTDLVGALEPLLTLTVPQNQGRILKAGVDVDDVREALNCSNTPATTTTPPTSTTTPAPNGDERDCTDFATRQDAQDFYDSVTTPGNPDPSKLDRDGDGQACEPNEGASGSGSSGIDPTQDDGSVTAGGQVVDVPEGSASTGGGV